MIIVLRPGTGEADIEDVCRRIESLGLRAHVSRGEQRTIIGAIGDDRFKTRVQALEALECVESLVPIATLDRWFREAALREVKVYRRGHLCGHGIR